MLLTAQASTQSTAVLPCHMELFDAGGFHCFPSSFFPLASPPLEAVGSWDSSCRAADLQAAPGPDPKSSSISICLMVLWDQRQPYEILDKSLCLICTERGAGGQLCP